MAQRSSGTLSPWMSFMQTYPLKASFNASALLRPDKKQKRGGYIAFSHLASPLFFQITSAISLGMMRLKRGREGGTVLLEIFYRHYCPRRCRWVCRRLTAVLIHLKYGPNIAAPSSWEQSDTPSHDLWCWNATLYHGAQCRSFINTWIVYVLSGTARKLTVCAKNIVCINSGNFYPWYEHYLAHLLVHSFKKINSRAAFYISWYDVNN